MRVGVLTGGGDCPGLNAAIRAIVRIGIDAGHEFLGFHHGWRGVVEREFEPLVRERTRGILASGGTILHTARYHPASHKGGVEAALATIRDESLDAIIVIGGDGTLTAAVGLAELGAPIVGIPKTIDNDVAGTSQCIGFDTATATAADAIDRVHSTGESHDRLMVVEVMGRRVGWLAASAGIAAGADAICLPEDSTDLERLADAIIARHDGGSTSSIVVVAEGVSAVGADTMGSAGAMVAGTLRHRTGYDTRLTVLGHVQRGGTPTAADRLIATKFGAAAVEAVTDHNFGTMVASCDDSVRLVPLDVVRSSPRQLPESLLRVVRHLTI